VTACVLTGFHAFAIGMMFVLSILTWFFVCLIWAGGR
jgi:hypothetical protein